MNCEARFGWGQLESSLSLSLMFIITQEASPPQPPGTCRPAPRRRTPRPIITIFTINAYHNDHHYHHHCTYVISIIIMIIMIIIDDFFHYHYIINSVVCTSDKQQN